MLRTRRPASRPTANASTSRSSSLAPLSSFCLNSGVLAWSSASLSFLSFSSSALMATTFGCMRRIDRSFAVPKSFLATQVSRELLAFDAGNYFLVTASASNEAVFRLTERTYSLTGSDHPADVVQVPLGRKLVMEGATHPLL